MALFKIFKGNETAKLTDSNASGYRVPTDGYAYYDTSSNLFYIDAAYGSDNTITRKPINANISNIAMNGVYYGICDTAAATKAKVATLVNGDGFHLATGVMIAIKFAYASAKSTMTLSVNGSTAKNLVLYGTSAMADGTTTSGWRAGAVVPFVYDGTSWVRLFWENSTYTITSVWCNTAAGTAAKASSNASYYVLKDGNIFEMTIRYTNTAAQALTLNVNTTGAKVLYINGEPSSTTNYTLPAGKYLVRYDASGNNGNGCYHIRTDGKVPVDIAGNAATATYATTAGSANAVAWANVTGHPVDATNTTGGLLTDAQAVKLAGISTGAEVNQNAFGKVKVGSTTVEADAKVDTLELVGSNVTLTPDATNDKVTIGLTSANVIAALGYTPPTTNTTYDVATQSANGLMSSTDKTKLDGIATGAEVNQNAFSNIKVGNSTVAADSKTDTLELVGSNVTLTPDTTNDKITIGITSANVISALGYTPPQQDTTYSNATTSAAGLMSADDKTKLNGIATGAEVNQNAFGKVKVGSTTVEADAKIDTLELVGSNVTITPDATNDKVTIGITKTNVTTALGYTPPTQDTTYSAATQSASGLMSSDDKTKLDGIATGAEVNQNAFSTVAVLASGSGTATNVTADSKTDTLTLAGSSTVTLTGDATNDKVTFSLTSSNVTTALGYTPPQQDTTYSAATQSAAGLMSAADKKKLDGIATGAQVNVLESVTASGTAPLTLTAGSVSNKSIAISGSIADASTSAKGVVKIGDGISVSNGVISVTASGLGLSSAMLFKGSLGTGGTITSLPTAAAGNTGYTYKVITAGTYASQAAKVGDVFVSNGSSWILIPSGDEPSGTVTSVGVSNATNGGLTVTSSPITTSGTISIGHTNVLTNAQTTQALYPIKIDKNGHISAYGTAVTSLPASDVSAWAKAATKPTYNWGEISQSGANNIEEGTADFTDNTELFSSYASNNGFADSNATGKVYRRDAIKLYNYVKTKLAVTNNNINLSRNTETTIATIGGTAIKIKLPASDNTDTKQNVTLATTSKAYLTGVTTTPTSSAQALTGVADTGVYLTTTAGEFSAVRHSFNVSSTEKAYMTYNSTTESIDFIFV